MSYSQKLINKCRTHGLTIEQFSYCTLLYSDFTKVDAYIIAFRPTTNSEQKLKSAIGIAEREEPVKLYLNYLSKLKDSTDNEQLRKEQKIRKQIEQEYAIKYSNLQGLQEGSVQPTDTDTKSQRTKEDIIRELNVFLDVETDPKLRLDYFKQLTDLQQMKKEQERDDDETVHYYFPITCKECQNIKGVASLPDDNNTQEV